MNHSRGIDGLVFYKNSLIGVQNYVEKLEDISIVQYHLSGDLSRIVRTEIIDTNNPAFDIPTTAVLVNDDLFVLSNSHLRNLDQKNLRIKDPSKLRNLTVLKYRLKP
jgi:hypothetical protein